MEQLSIMELTKFIVVLASLFFFSCSKPDNENEISIDPAIPAGILGNYRGDCNIYKYSHTGQVGGLMTERDTIFNSLISVTEILPITNYYHRITAVGDCFPLTEFLVDNKDFLKDSTVMYDEENHDILELIWVKSEDLIKLRYKDREYIGVNYITFDGIFRLE